MSHRALTVAEFLDAAKMRGLILRVPLLCGLVMVAEGVDLNGIGYAGPLITRAYHIAPQALGIIYAGTVLGSLMGAVLVAPMADRIGRRALLVGSSLLLGLCTASTPFATGAWQLFLVRLLIGAGFGAAVPSVFAMTADYMPSRMRVMVLNAVSGGVAIGVVIAGLTAAFVIPTFGWRPMMYVSGAGSLACAGLLFAFLPESLSFSLRRRPDHPRSQALIERLKIEQAVPSEVVFIPEEAQVAAHPPTALLTGGRLKTTVTLVIALVMTYAVQTFLSYWLPTLLLASGATMKAAGLVSATGKVLGICGSAGVGFAMDRRDPWVVLPIMYVLAAAAIIALGFSVTWTALAMALLMLSDALVDSSFGGASALSAAAFPSSMRATSAGWILGLSRLIGGGGGAMVGGFVVGAHWPTSRTAFVMAAPLALGAVALLVSVRLRRGWTAAAAPAYR